MIKNQKIEMLYVGYMLKFESTSETTKSNWDDTVHAKSFWILGSQFILESIFLLRVFYIYIW